MGGGRLEQLVHAPKVVQAVALSQLTAMPGQPRRSFDPATLADLARSLQAQGVLQPLLVRPGPRGRFEIVAGERRFRAAQLAGLDEVPVVVRELDDAEAQTLALVENLQREDLNPVDRVDATAQLIAQALEVPTTRVPAQLSALQKHPEAAGHPALIARVEEVFSVVGGSWRSFLTHQLPVLRFPDDVLAAVRSGQVEYTKGAVLARVVDPAERARLLALARDGASLQALRAAARPERQVDERQGRVDRVTRALRRPEQLGRLPAAERKRVDQLIAELDRLLGSGTGTQRRATSTTPKATRRSSRTP